MTDAKTTKLLSAVAVAILTVNGVGISRTLKNTHDLEAVVVDMQVNAETERDLITTRLQLLEQRLDHIEEQVERK